jgi:hypothetical protein
MTMAIHGANPIIIKPVRYSGLSFRKKIDNKNIKKGPTIHVIINDATRILGFLNMNGILLKSTLVNGGYIMSIRPIANGILVVPEEKELIKLAEFGIKYPIPTPISMAKNIHNVKNLSKKFSLFFMFFLSLSRKEIATF